MSGCNAGITTDKELKVGPDKNMQMNGVAFQVTSIEKLKEVKPAKPSGYYNYYEEKVGYSYFVVTGKAENKSSYSLDADNIIVRGFLNDQEYEGKLLFSNAIDSNFIKKLEKNQTQTFYIVLLVKDKNELPDTVEIFYNNSFEKTQLDDHYDNSICWILPSSD